MRSTSEMRLKFYGSDGKSYSTINSDADNALFTLAALAKMQVVSILLLWTNSQESVEFF